MCAKHQNVQTTREYVMKIVRRLFKAAIGVSLVATFALAGIAPASAQPELPPLAIANPDINIDVIKGFPEWVQQRPDIQVDKSITASTPMITTDGLPLEGQAAGKMAAAAECGRQLVGIPSVWTAALPSSCGVIGVNSSTTVTYTLITNTVYNGTACMQARGYILDPAGNSKEMWYTGGCSSAWSNVSHTVPWGNVASVPAVKIQQVGIIGWAGKFVH